jgi:hypothetical protein
MFVIENVLALPTPEVGTLFVFGTALIFFGFYGRKKLLKKK